MPIRRSSGVRHSLEPQASTGDPNIAWLNSYPVQQALKEVGEPDGTDEWRFNFATALLKHTEEGARITRDADRMAYLAGQWNAMIDQLTFHDTDTQKHGGTGVYVGGVVPTDLLEQMLEILSLEQLARYLGTLEYKLLGYLFPRVDVETLRQGARHFRMGMGLHAAAKHVGTSFAVLRRYLDYTREPTPNIVTSNGRVQRSPAVRQRILDMAAEGLGPSAILERIKAELPVETDGLTYHAVKQLVWRAKQAA